MNTQDLMNYIKYMESGIETRKRKTSNSKDLENSIINEAINQIDLDYDNVDITIENIYNSIDEYSIKKTSENKKKNNESKLYNMAIYSIIIHIMEEYIKYDQLVDFKTYLNDLKQKYCSLKPIATIPFTAFLDMLLGPQKDKDNQYEDEDEDSIPRKKYRKNNRKSSEFINEMFRLSRSKNDEKDIASYYSSLPVDERDSVFSQLKDINDYQNIDKPKVFQIMEYPIPLSQKNHILKNYVSILNSHFPDNKLRTWFDNLMSIPFGKYKGIDLAKSNQPNKIKKFLRNLRTVMDDAVWGHDDAKHQIIQMMAQQISNPKCKGNVLGIWGPPGNGKTTLIKEGIAKALNKPFVFISLGGASDSSFLEGHSYTYEGSIYGRIANGIITSGCMNPIIYFDELDKISRTPKGDEITNILVHLTDPVQNTHFRDKYFHGIDIDLSRATIIFSFNDISNVNPILLDRITTIETKYLMSPQKIHIAQKYLLPNILKETGLDSSDIVFEDEDLSKVIDKYTREGGVRKLKSLLYNIVREVNLIKSEDTKLFDNKINYPLLINNDHIELFLKSKIPALKETVPTDSKVGFINGLYAGSLGIGGVLPIQILWTPSNVPLMPKLTGNLKKVIKESATVATTLAWNNINSDLQVKYASEWKKKPYGFHIHFPEGAIPKDGPSAGTALSVAIYSMLTNRQIKAYVAITGEINFEGNVTAIGGLEEKLVGAKKAGVKHALIPFENKHHFDKVKERNPSLLDETFNVTLIKTLDDALHYSLV